MLVNLRSLAIAMLVFRAGLSFAALQYPPSMRTPEDYARFLYYLQTEMPQLLEQGAEYDVDLLDIIKQQNDAVRGMKENKTFAEIARERPELWHLTFQMIGKQQVLQSGYDPEKVAAVRASAALLSGEPSFQEMTEGVLASDPSGLVTGLIQSHPNAETRKELFKLAPEALLKAVEGDDGYSDLDLRKGFRKGSHGLDVANLTKASLIQKIRTLRRARRTLAQRLIREADRQEKVTEGELPLVLQNPELRTPFLKAFMNKVASEDYPEAQSAEWVARAETFVAEWSKGLVSSKKIEKEIITDEFYLNEVPPYLGAFRGFVGGDCATQYSFIFSYAPHEKTFFILDNKGVLRGYVMATLIRVRGRGALYVHDIVGPTVSRRMVDTILQGLYQKREKLDFELLVLPTKERTFENNNYEFVRTHLQSYVENKAKVALEYEDESIRTFLASYPGIKTVDTYDLPANNPHGHIFVPDDEKRWDDLRVGVLRKPDASLVLPEMDAKASTLLALDLLQAVRSTAARESVLAEIATTTNPQPLVFGLRESVAKQVIAFAQVSETPFDELNALLPNPSALSINDYYREVERLAGELGIDLQNLLKVKPYFFYEGHLIAKDAFAGDHRETSVDHAVHLLKRWPKSAVALGAVARHPALFSANLRFRNYVASLLIDQHSEAEKLEQLLSFEIDFDFLMSHFGKIQLLKKSRLVSVKRAASELISRFESRKTKKISCADEVIEAGQESDS